MNTKDTHIENLLAIYNQLIGTLSMPISSHSSTMQDLLACVHHCILSGTEPCEGIYTFHFGEALETDIHAFESNIRLLFPFF